MLILPGSKPNEFTIGKYHMRKQHNTSWVVSERYSDWTQEFQDRRSALFYCICMQTRALQAAKDISFWDHRVLKLTLDRWWYKRSQQVAERGKDWSSWDIADARISDVDFALYDAKERLEKSLQWAKYLKPRDGQK